MKIILVLVTLFVSLTALAEVVATCDRASFPAAEDEAGRVIWQTVPLSVVVSKTEDTYNATVVARGNTLVINEGIEVRTVRGGTKLRELQNLLLLANLPWRKAKWATHYDLQPEANRQDLGGASLTVIHMDSGAIMKKVVQLGWGLGICK